MLGNGEGVGLTSARVRPCIFAGSKGRHGARTQRDDTPCRTVRRKLGVQVRDVFSVTVVMEGRNFFPGE